MAVTILFSLYSVCYFCGSIDVISWWTATDRTSRKRYHVRSMCYGLLLSNGVSMRDRAV